MWDYPRGSIAYDIKVAAILAFIFLTPSSLFRDQPLLSPARDRVVMLPGTGSETRFGLEESLIVGVPEDQRFEGLAGLLSERTGKARRVVLLEPAGSAEGKVHGYIAVTTP